MKTKHTAGKWQVKQENSGKPEANAKLIAVAPEMLDALILLTRELSEFYTPQQSEALRVSIPLLQKLNS